MKNHALDRPPQPVQSPRILPTAAPHVRSMKWQAFGRTTFFSGCLAIAMLISSPPSALAQVVQLPGLRTFSSSGSVLVPDGGSAMLGATANARQSSTNSGFGPLTNRALAGSAGSTTLAASVQIIDLEALDRAILASAAPRTTVAGQTSPPASTAVGPAATPAGDSSVDAGRRARLSSRYPDSTRELAANNSERVRADPGKWQRVLSGSGTPTPINTSMVETNVRYYVELGQRAERSGSPQAARVYYRLARQAMTPELVAQYENVLRIRAAESAASSAAQQEQTGRKF